MAGPNPLLMSPRGGRAPAAGGVAGVAAASIAHCPEKSGRAWNAETDTQAAIAIVASVVGIILISLAAVRW